MSRTKDREEFVYLMTREYGDYPGLLYKLRELMRYGRALHRFAEHDCNVGLTDAQQTSEDRTKDRVRAICAALPGCEPVFSGDPRGAVLKLKVRSGHTNDWGGIGICVP